MGNSFILAESYILNYIMSKGTCLITGASGLLGRQLVKTFEDDGWLVIGTAFSRCGDGLYKVDLRNSDEVMKFVSEKTPQMIIHAAAER